MKKKMFYLVSGMLTCMVVFLTSCGNSQQQQPQVVVQQQPQAAPQVTVNPGIDPQELIKEGLDLKMVGLLAGDNKITSLEMLERELNKTGGINNLRLDPNQENVNYIFVKWAPKNAQNPQNVKSIDLLTLTGPQDTAHLATIDITQQPDQTTQVAVMGNTNLYGTMDNSYAYTMPTPMYATNPYWLSMLFWSGYNPYYYHSPYHWGYYPGWYHPYHYVSYGVYHSYRTSYYSRSPYAGRVVVRSVPVTRTTYRTPESVKRNFSSNNTGGVHLNKTTTTAYDTKNNRQVGGAYGKKPQSSSTQAKQQTPIHQQTQSYTPKREKASYKPSRSESPRRSSSSGSSSRRSGGRR